MTEGNVGNNVHYYVAPPALQGIQDPADIPTDCLEPDIMLLHPRENQCDGASMLFRFSFVSGKVVSLPGDDLDQVPNECSHNPDLAPKVGKAGSGPVRVVP